jgi:peroxiredoxin Q/BCP
LQANYQQFQQHKAEILALAVQDTAQAQRMVQVAGTSFPILADPDHHVAEAYGVYNLLGDGVATPAVFVIDHTGQIVWSYIGRDISDRPSAQTVLEHLP